MSNMFLAPRNFWDLMTVSTSIAPATGFEITNTQNDDRGQFWQSPDATGQDVKGFLPSGSVTVSWFSMHMHHCHGGLITVIFYPNNDWTGTPLYTINSSPGAIYAPITTGYDWGYADYPGLDTHDPLGLESDFYATFPAVSGVKSVKISFSSKSTTYGFAYWSATRFMIGNYLEPAINPDYGMTVGRIDMSESKRSLGGSNLTKRGARIPVVEFTLSGIRESEMPTWLQIDDQCQGVRTVTMSIFPGVGGFEERNHLFCGTLKLEALGRQVSRLTAKARFEGI